MFGVSSVRAAHTRALVRRIRGGDASAEDEFARLLERDVRSWLLVRTRDREMADELANDVLMAAISALRSGRFQDADRLGAYVLGIMRNLVNHRLRVRLARPREVPLPGEIARECVPDDVERCEHLAAAERAFAGLTPADRDILVRMVLDDVKPSQVARELGVSLVAVRARKSRALHRLLTTVRLGAAAGPR